MRFKIRVYLGRLSRMPRRASTFSKQTLAILAVLVAEPSAWRHGYDLGAAETGLKSGTLYPILVRLADRDMVEACWEQGEPAGRPRRHLYRLTSDGLAAATAALAATPATAPRAASRAGLHCGASRRPGLWWGRVRDGADDLDAAPCGTAAAAGTPTVGRGAAGRGLPGSGGVAAAALARGRIGSGG